MAARRARAHTVGCIGVMILGIMARVATSKTPEDAPSLPGRYLGEPVIPVGGFLEPVGEDGSVLELAREYRRRLERRLGPRLIEVRLFGSRARGDERPDSDLDLFVLVDRADRRVRNIASDLATDLNLERGFEPCLAPLVMDRPEFDLLLQRERRLALDVVNEGIPV